MGRTVENTLKGDGTEKRRGETKIFKKGWGQAGSRGECLKKGAGTPLRTVGTVLVVWE